MRMGDEPPAPIDTVPREVREVAGALVDALGDDLKALLWHGSYARGEAGPGSDHDLIIVLRRAGDDVLLQMREVFRGRANWSTYVQTEEELRQYPRDGRLQFHFGAVLLHGDFDPPPFTREDVIDEIRVLARQVRFEARYRLLHKEPLNAEAESEFARFQRQRTVRMLGYALKWAVLALKARELLEGRTYPITRAELRARLSDPADIAIVGTQARWHELVDGYATDPVPLALQLDAFAARIVSQLPALAARE
jgi:predicted nucleotidyltransferase